MAAQPIPDLALPDASGARGRRTAIIDIGSNSVRLVVYQGVPRLPATLFNEKVMAGLGRGLAGAGAIEPDALARGRQALARFAAVAREMRVDGVRTVATAAVRDASNGHELIDAAAELGLSVELLSGDQEAKAAGLGVLSAFPDADGIVGDLGGGSLELVRVAGGRTGERASFPLGVLRLAALRASDAAAAERRVVRAIRDAGWRGGGAGLPFYLVGGSWRAVARLHMTLNRYPLPIIHGYALPAAAAGALARRIAGLTRQQLRDVPGLSAARAATLGDAAWLLDILVRELGAREILVSAFGLREGLLYGALDEAARAEDPLIVAAREEGRLLGRFAEHGDLLDAWVAPAFAPDGPVDARLRHAACLLTDVGWHANPEFRAERGVETALHGNWVAIDARGRAVLAQALASALAGTTDSPDPLPRLAEPAALKIAAAWGLAIRLGQRLSGGVAGPLRRSRLSCTAGQVVLHLAPGDRQLYGELVERRHKALAQALGREAALG